MKVQFKNLLKAYSGNIDGLVYYYNSRLDMLLCRSYVKPRESDSNIRMGLISRNLKQLAPSEAFIADLKLYIAMHRNHEGNCKLLSWSNAYTKLMYALAAKFGADLITLSKAEIYAQNYPCISVKRAMAAGLLPVVAGCERLDAEF